MDMKHGDLIFVRGTDTISRIIEWLTSSKYSHVAMYIGNGEVIEAQRLRSVGLAPLSEYDGKYDVYTCPTLTDDQRKQIIEYARSMGGIKYDYLDIARLFLRCVFRLELPIDDPTRIICSELIVKAYSKAGIKLVQGREDYDVTPEDVAESKMLKML
jgi:cell wall-associated NlpC family hydrolase